MLSYMLNRASIRSTAALMARANLPRSRIPTLTKMNAAVARVSATEPANAAHGAMDLRTPGVCRLRRGPENPPATGTRVSEPLLPSRDRAGGRRLVSAGQGWGITSESGRRGALRGDVAPG